MPRNGSGSYSLPKPAFTAGTTIASADVNSDFSDIASAITGSVAANGETPITGPLKFAPGSAAAPSHTFGSDTATGLYLAAGGQLGIATGGVVAVLVNSDQTVTFEKAITIVSGGITVTAGGAAITGDSSIAGILTLTSTNNLVLPIGTTGQRPAAQSAGRFRYNSTSNTIEIDNGSSWVTVTPPVVPAQGRLTPVSGTAVITADSISATSVFYTPFRGNVVPLYDGANSSPATFTELTLTLAAQHLASTIYDVFLFSNAGTLTLATGPAWSNSAAGSGARGTGAGTTELQRINGNWVNKNTMGTARNGASTFSVGANLGLYVGSLFIDATPGQVTSHVSYAQSRKFGVWNADNRMPVYLKAGDGTASWIYNTATWRPSNNVTANSLITFSGLAEEMHNLEFIQSVYTNSNVGSVPQSFNGIGYDVVNGQSGKMGMIVPASYAASGSATTGADMVSRYLVMPTIGIHTITAMEKGNPSTGSNFLGTEPSMLLSALWRA